MNPGGALAQARAWLAGRSVPGEAERLADFEAFYAAHAGLVRRTVFGLGGREDLDDIVQECFLRLWKSWGGFRGESRRTTWVYRVAVNTARQHWRSKGRRRAAMARFLEEPRPDAVPAPQEGGERRRALASALEGLSLEQREAVTLVYFEGLGLAEAAAACGVPEGTVKSRLFHARRGLEAALQEVPE